MKPWLKTSLTIFLSAIVFLITLELGLQIYGIYLDHERKKLLPELEGKIRILALGESTTDPLTNQAIPPWTKYLEEDLNRKHPSLKFALINKGRAGTSTNFILENLPIYLERFKPHLVIAMMGVNDGSEFSFLHQESFISRLKILRLIKLELLHSHSPYNKLDPKVYKLVKNIKSPGPLPFELKKLMDENPDHLWFVHKIVGQRYLDLLPKLDGKERDKIEQEAFSSFKRAFTLNPENMKSLCSLLYSSQNQSHLKKEARDILKNALKNDSSLSSTLMESIHYADPKSDPELLKLLWEKGMRKHSYPPLNVTRHNYHLLEKIVRESGGRLAIMAYPTTKIDLYKHLFTDFNLNEWSFRQAMAQNLSPAIVPEKYQHLIFIENPNFPFTFDEAFYTDMMVSAPQVKVGFGHLTAKGNELIGKNAGEVLSREWVPELIRPSR